MNGAIITTEWTCNGRHVRPGTELSIRAERGRFRFVRHVQLPDGRAWVDVIGGKSTRRGTVELERSFRPDRVTQVHRKPRNPRRVAA